MSPAICEPLPSPLFPAISARVVKESLSVIGATLAVCLVALSLAFLTAPEVIQEATARLPAYAIFP